MNDTNHAIIGAGLAGLACANRLRNAGYQVEVFDKARGPGGRLSSRRRFDTTFDLGCQQLSATTTEFHQQLKLWQKEGWVDSNDQQCFYGVPRMSGLTRQLSSQLKIRLATRITALHKKATDWWLEDESGQQYGPYQQVTLATPVAQALPLITEHSQELSQQLAAARHTPNWVAYFVLPNVVSVAASPALGLPSTQALRRWTLLNDKPGQLHALQKWVVEASAQWTQQHLEITSEQAARQIFELWKKEAALDTAQQPIFLEAHRWLYSLTATAVGQAFVQDIAQGLSVCGDYCLGAQAEHAWFSGDKLGQQLTRSTR